jgi:hypothetical protein
VTFLLAILTGGVVASSPDLRLDDPRTLRTGGLPALLGAFHAGALDGGRTGHILPRPDTAVPVGGLEMLGGVDSSLVLQPKIGLEWRNPDDEGQFALDVGGELRGRTDHLAFWVDARMVTAQTSESRRSWDGQYQEFQKEGLNSRVDYTSFSRWEGKLAWESGIGRIGMGRSRQHWGPSYSYPLVLGAGTAPMPLFDWTSTWRNFRVRALWASLAIDGAGSFRGDAHTRSMYGHRYEWRAADWLTLGASEALIVYDRQEPAALLPFAPLFMEKGQGLENDNNGELAFDLELRPRQGWRLYGEFLVDDVSEPTSLFNDMWKNRWAVTVGTHVAKRIGAVDLGGILELSHVEPWVYAHYYAKTVQASHQGFLLGNPSGPNSRSVKATGYGVWRDFHLESSIEWVWKGTDFGSKWTDAQPDNETSKKVFLAGGGDLDSRSVLHVGWTHRYGTIWVDLAKTFASADLQRVRPSAPVAIRLEATY